jgi:DNA-3-methyladenine glycosylase I
VQVDSIRVPGICCLVAGDSEAGRHALATYPKLVQSSPPLSIAYHDSEWGVPVHDDHSLFEFLTLEGAQAGLSWLTILKKRAHYRHVFDGFDPAKVARYDENKIAALLDDPGIIRNRAKIRATITNAGALLRVQQDFRASDRLSDGFNEYLWRFTDGFTVHNKWRTLADVPARNELSDALSQDLKRRGFSFVGSTICYSLLQAVGLVNDHLVDCFRHRELRVRDGQEDSP